MIVNSNVTIIIMSLYLYVRSSYVECGSMGIWGITDVP